MDMQGQLPKPPAQGGGREVGCGRRLGDRILLKPIEAKQSQDVWVQWRRLRLPAVDEDFILKVLSQSHARVSRRTPRMKKKGRTTVRMSVTSFSLSKILKKKKKKSKTCSKHGPGGPIFC